MLALELALLLVLLVVSSFAPGFFLLRRLPWSPAEKLCGSIGLSLVLAYLASWGIYCFWPGSGPIGAAPYAAISLISAALAWASWRDIVNLGRAPRVRRMVIGYAFLLGWALLLLAVIRNYSGANWSADWLEHFQRSLFFIDRFPVRNLILRGYALPARPPMMNVVAGFFLAQTSDRFENLQVIFCFLNLLLFLPCCLMLPRLAGPRRTRILPSVALFSTSPLVMENVTYTWTKALAAFYVVLAIYFYLAAWSKRDRMRMIAAFLSLSAGLLVHYSAAPYALFLSLHYAAVVFWKRPRKWREAVIIGATCSLLLATWFGWSLHNYGAKGTFESNTSVTSSRDYQGGNLAKIAGNLFDSIVPAALRDPASFDAFQQPTRAGWIRDAAFVSYQANVLFNLGILGGPLAVWFIVAAVRRPSGITGTRNFYLALVLFCLVVGIAVAGERDSFGVAHLTLLPLAVLGLTLIASAFPWRRFIAILVIAGCVVDFSIGVFLHVHLESLENTPRRTIFTGVQFIGGGGQVGKPGPDSLSKAAWVNWVRKHNDALARQWSAEITRHSMGNPRIQAAWAGFLGDLQQRIDEDGFYWHGWYSRHAGNVTFLGDDIAGGSGASATIAEGILLIMMLSLMTVVAREAWKRAPQPVLAAPAKARARRKASSKSV